MPRVGDVPHQIPIGALASSGARSACDGQSECVRQGHPDPPGAPCGPPAGMRLRHAANAAVSDELIWPDCEGGEFPGDVGMVTP